MKIRTYKGIAAIAKCDAWTVRRYRMGERLEPALRSRIERAFSFMMVSAREAVADRSNGDLPVGRREA
jgi:hypothetical protein